MIVEAKFPKCAGKIMRGKVRELIKIKRTRSLLVTALALMLLPTRSSAQNANDGFSPSVNSYIEALIVQPDGNILIGGVFTAAGGSNHLHIARLDVDGSVDHSFRGAANETVYTLAVQPDGRILVGGSFTRLLDRPRAYLGRLNPDGTLDETFECNADNVVETLALLEDGKILVGGHFTMIGGQSRHRIARLNSDGNVDVDFDLAADNVVYAEIRFAPDRGHPKKQVVPHLRMIS